MLHRLPPMAGGKRRRGVEYTEDLTIERFYRNAPLMIVSEGTNEIQKLVIARQLLERHPL